MSQKINPNKISNEKNNISRFGLAVKRMEGVSEFSEKKPDSDKPISEAAYIGSFSFNEKNMNYILIKSNGISFINFRMNLTYEKPDMPEEVNNESGLLNYINIQNSKNIGIKTFITKETDNEFIVSVNSEYILDSANENFEFIPHVINILSISPGILQIKKSKG